MALLAVALPGLLLLRASAVRLGQPRQVLIPSTDVLMPDDYEDYTRSRIPWRLFRGSAPGNRVAMPSFGPGLPGFDPNGSSVGHPIFKSSTSAEAFVDASPLDAVGRKCAPGGDAAGHNFYNVWDPELVHFIVDHRHPDFQSAAVIVAPGGGFVNLAWEAEGIAAAEWLNSIGISAFVLKYRVPHNGSELAVIDAQRAMVLVRGRAESYRIDPKRIGVLGFSAGGLMAIELGMQPELLYEMEDPFFDRLSPLPNFLMLLYPGVDLHQGPDGVREIPETFPPTFLAYAADDPCCPVNITRTFSALAKSALRSKIEAVEYAQGKHGWSSCDYYPQLKGLPNCNWHAFAERFLRRHVFHTQLPDLGRRGRLGAEVERAPSAPAEGA